MEVYSYNLETITYKMLDGAAKAETAGNLIKNVLMKTLRNPPSEYEEAYSVLKNIRISEGLHHPGRIIDVSRQHL